MMSINDTFILQSLVFRLIQRALPAERSSAVISVFEQIKFRTEVGQMLDLHTVDQEKHCLNFQYD